MSFNNKSLNLFYSAIILICFMLFVSPAAALGFGIFLSLIGLKHNTITNYTSVSLKASIILMGFGMNLVQVINTSKEGFTDTAISVLFVMFTGLTIGKLLKIDSKIVILISAGTGICGGSAIAAIAPVIKAEKYQISFSLVVIFILNAIALLIFPLIGHYMHLSQETFGYWAAIAIHDTSSVVGAGATYGAKALEVATTVKLIRALWIVPLSIVIALSAKDKSGDKIKIPWFIFLFVVSVIITNLLPDYKTIFTELHWLGKRGMVVSLLLIGSGISISEAKEAGIRSFVLGILLWLIIGSSSLIFLTN